VWVTVSGPPQDTSNYFGSANFKDIDEPWSFRTNDPTNQNVQFRFKGRMIKPPGYFTIAINGAETDGNVIFGSMRENEAADFLSNMIIEMSSTGRDVLVRAHDVSDSVADLANLPDHDAPGPGPKKWVQLGFIEKFIKAESVVREGASIISSIGNAIGNRRSVYKLDWGDGSMYLVLRTHISGVGPKGITVWLDNKPIGAPGSGSRPVGVTGEVTAETFTAAPIGTTLDIGVTTPNHPIGRIFEIRNTSTTKPVSLANFAVTGDFVGELLTPEIAPGATGQFRIVFLASRKGGLYKGSVSFNADTVPASETDTFFTINLQAQSGDIIPAINTFTATPSAISAGQPVILTWSVSNATSVSISPGIGTVAASGSRTVNPGTTTNYELTAINGSETVRRLLPVTVVGDGPPGSPTIASFRAAPDSVQPGQTSALTWDVQNATSLTITPGGTVTGTSFNVTPSQTTTYILRATNASGTSSRAATVFIGATSAPVVNSFTATPEVLSGPGQSTLLAWDVTNAATVTISPSVGPVSSSGTRTISPSVTTLYTLTATNSAGTTTKPKTVTVQGTNASGTPPSIQAFIASSTSAAPGEPVTLTWNVEGADLVILAPPLTAVNPAESRQVSSQATTTYTLFARNGEGSVSQEITVTVAGGPAVPVINEFVVQPQPVVLGGNGEIRWNTTGAASVTIAPDIGSVGAFGVKTITPGIDSIVVLTATNGAGSISKAAIIDIEKGTYAPLGRSIEILRGTSVETGLRLEHNKVTQLYDPLTGYVSGSIPLLVVNRTAGDITISRASLDNSRGGGEIFSLTSELKDITLAPDQSVPVTLRWSTPVSPRDYRIYFSVSLKTSNTTGSSHEFRFHVPEWRSRPKNFDIVDASDVAIGYELQDGPFDNFPSQYWNLGLPDSSATATKLFKVRNRGTAPLQVTQVWCASDDFSIRATPVGTGFPLAIPPNGFVTLRATARSMYQSTGTGCVIQVQTPGEPVTEGAFAGMSIYADGLNEAPIPLVIDSTGHFVDDHGSDSDADELLTRIRPNRRVSMVLKVKNANGHQLKLQTGITVSGNGFRLARGYYAGANTIQPLLSIFQGLRDEALFKIEFTGKGAGTYNGVIKLPMWASSTDAPPAQWERTFEIHWKVVVGNGRTKVSQGPTELDNGGGFDADEATTFTITNTSDSTLNLSGLAVPPHYTVGSALPRSLAAGQSGSFSATRVGSAAEGPHYISFNVDDPDEPIFQLRENHKPVAVRDTVTVDAGADIPVDVTANDTDADGDGLSLSPLPIVTQPSKGTVVETQDSVLVYSANAGTTGGDRFVYEVSDGNGGISRAEVLVTIGAGNRNPVANPDSVSTKAGVPVTINVVANDLDPDGDPVLLITSPIVVPPENGLAEKLDGSNIRYTPNANFLGTDTFTYEVGDTFGKRARAVVTVFVGNTKPVAVADAAVTKPGRAVILNVVANDSDPDGDDVFLISDPIFVAPQHGTAVKLDGARIEYTPGAAFIGVDTFTYEIGDGFGMRARAVVTITVANVKPVAQPDTASTPRNAPVRINVVANDSDPDGDRVWLIAEPIAVPPAHGTASRTNDNEITYAPAAGFVGIDSFTYEIGDGAGGRDRAVVTITVANFGPPVARNDRAYTQRDTPVTIDVLANDRDPDGQAIALTAAAITAQPKHGSVVRTSNTSVTYTPFSNYTGNDSFQYEIVDTVGKKDRAWVTVHIGRTKLAPVAIDDASETPSNQTRSINVLANDGSPDGDAIWLTASPILEYPRWGQVARASDSNITYTAKNGFVGTDRFKYQITDSEGRKGSAFVTVTVTQVNGKPVAVADNAATHINQPVTIDVTANDSDPDGDPVALIANPIITAPQHGTAIRVSASSIAYSPAAGFSGTDTFEYEIGDGNGKRDRALVNVSVSDTNHVPEAEDDTATTSAGTAVTINVTANDSDPDGDRVVLITNPIIIAPAHGTATKISATEITYKPASGFTGTDTFQYEVGDGHAGRSRAIVTVTVGEGEVNHNPVAADDEFPARVSTAVELDVTANDSDPDGDTVFLISNPIIVAPVHGTAVKVNGTTVRYTPNTDYVGVDTFQYEIGDGRGKRSRAWVRVTVQDANSRPVAVNDIASTRPGVAKTVRVIDNDYDPDGDPVHITAEAVVVAPEHGTAVNVGGHSITYTPSAGFHGTDRLKYQIGDGHGLRARAWLNITVAANAAANIVALSETLVPPVADNDLGEGITDTAVPVVVLANDITIDGKSVILTAEPVVTAPEFGTIARTNDTTLTFTPAAGFRGNDRFEYEVVASDGSTTRAWATVQIPGNNQPPVAVADEVTMGRVASSVIRPLINDSDPDDDPLSLSLRAVTIPPLHGTVRRDGNLELVYAPEAGFFGDDVFTYEISDERGGLASATVTVHVINAVDPPTAANDAATGESGKPIAIDVLANDADPNNEPLRISASTRPLHGTIVWSEEGGTVTYRSDAGYVGLDRFTYTVSDTDGLTAQAEVAVTLIAVNAPPILTNDVAETKTRTPVLIGVLANDWDPEWKKLVITAVSTPSGGTATIHRRESVSYEPGPDFAGTDTFEYTVSDGSSTPYRATVTVTVTNETPQPRSEILSAPEDTWVGYQAFNVLGNDTDPDGDELHIESVEQPDHGTFLVSTDKQQFSFKGPENWFGMVTFHYTVSDPFGASVRVMSQIRVHSVNDAPVAVDDSFSVYKNQLLTIAQAAVVGNDTDLEGDTIRIQSVDAPANGTAVLTEAGAIEYRPFGEFVGTDSFEYTIEDSAGGAFSSGRIHVTVLQDTRPVANFTVTCNDLACSFDASASTDDRGIVTYTWTLGNNSGAS
ncbi:MAG: large repetitive protein, partial [Acidobacteriota bacterium]|nr:large repetitive protein [Acidobacteriota bacterium]